jgi:transcriptional regulator with XRE-family HTH domain
MSTRVRVLEAARRRARGVRNDLGLAIRAARLAAGFRIRDVADAIGKSESWVSRVERGQLAQVSYVELSVLAAAVGLKMWTTMYPAERAIRDAPQLRLLRRLRARVGEGWRWRYEVVLPDRLDQRAADAVMERASVAVMVEAFTRLSDAQAQLRAVKVKARDLGVQRVVIVLQASAINRRALAEAADVVASDFPLGTRTVLASLASGRDPGANGIAVL